MGINCAPPVEELFLFCYEMEIMIYLSDYKQADIFDDFNTTPRYLDNILNINTLYVDNMVNHLYPSKLHLN